MAPPVGPDGYARSASVSEPREAVLSEDEALERLNGILSASDGDEEDEHVRGDALAWDALRALGWVRLADALARAAQHWWYA